MLETVFYLGHLEYAEGKLIRGVEVFRAGTYRGRTWTPDDIARMVANFQALQGRLDPPLRVNHSGDAWDVVGWVRRLYQEDDLLLADIEVTEPEALARIERGTFRKVSAEIYPNFVDDDGKEYGPTIRAIAIVDIPQVKTIRGIVLNSEALDLEGEGGTEVAEVEQMQERIAELEQEVQAYQEKVSNLESQVTSLQERLAAVEQERDEAKAQVASLQEQITAYQEAERKAKAEQEADAYIRAGKVTPAQKDHLVNLFMSLGEDEVASLKNMLDLAPAVDLGEKAEQTGEDVDITNDAFAEAWRKQFGS